MIKKKKRNEQKYCLRYTFYQHATWSNNRFYSYNKVDRDHIFYKFYHIKGYCRGTCIEKVTVILYEPLIIDNVSNILEKLQLGTFFWKGQANSL